ncbi:hypothetical protein [Fibrobacter sp.]|uniref:hypothetical protein n=1 Tax=Fibrobacter sp. TaxID=35828 RepID=UPI00388D7C29
MEYRVLVRFIGESGDLSELWNSFMERFPEAELPSEDSGDWYSVDEVMMDEYECRFEELPESELLAMDGCFLIDEEIPEDFLNALMERFERVYGVFKWSSTEVGIGCGLCEGWGEFIPDFAVDGSDEAYEISEAVLGF